MYTHLLTACLITLVGVNSIPVPNNELDIVQVPLSNGKELDVLTMGDSQTLTERNKRTIGLLRELFPDITKLNDNSIDLAKLNEQLEETIRVARQAEANNKKSEQSLNEIGDIKATTVQAATSTSSNDQTVSESKSPALDELSLDSTEDLDADDRNKRFLTLGGQGGAQGNSAGSGNFLFDIIRLFSGSVQTQTTDESANSPSEDSDSESNGNRANDGYQEAIPGPVTRLVVLANRGLANLVQDLILRIAATSERLVNFKAKVITALI
ncbi:hypothetical protein ACFFRR_001859 [Megaselia abdita]